MNEIIGLDDDIRITCTTCGNAKPLSEFAIHPRGKHGRRSKCTACRNLTRMEWVNANRERVRDLGAVAAAVRRTTADGAEKHRQASIRYYCANRDRVLDYRKSRWAESPVLRLLAWQRTSLHRLLKDKRIPANSSCAEMLGYTASELRAHIERQFTKGMRWDLVGSDIHIDHIHPVAAFVRDGITDAKIIHALPNLRPMWADENRAKRDKIEYLI
jgi:hypothetical protein